MTEHLRKWLPTVCGVAIVLFGSVVWRSNAVEGAASSGIIRARGLDLRNTRGERVGYLGIGPGSQVRLELRAPDTEAHMELSCGEEGSVMLRMADRQGRDRLKCVLAGTGGPSIVFCGPDGALPIMISEPLGPAITLRAPGGKPFVLAPPAPGH